MVSEGSADGLLIDLNMPDIDGFEVCRRIRSRKSLENMPLIAMSGRVSPEVRTKHLKQVFSPVWPNPFNPKM
jgi:CheY-like chemotaxis protein